MLSAELMDDGRKLAIRFLNDYGREIILPSPSPFIFLDLDGKPLYSVISAQILTRVKAGDRRDWVIDLFEIGVYKHISKGFVIKFSILEPRDEIYLIIRR